jgi:hypothetical protein
MGRGSFLRVLLLYADPVAGHPLLEIFIKQMISIPRTTATRLASA